MTLNEFINLKSGDKIKFAGHDVSVVLASTFQTSSDEYAVRCTPCNGAGGCYYVRPKVGPEDSYSITRFKLVSLKKIIKNIPKEDV